VSTMPPMRPDFPDTLRTVLPMSPARETRPLPRRCVLAVLVGLVALAAPAGAAAVGGAGGLPLKVWTRPAQPHAGTPFTVHLARAGGPDLDVSVCLESPSATAGCRTARFQGGRGRVTFTAPRTGSWTLVTRAPGFRAERELVISPIRKKLHVLAVGDSLMTPVARRLGRVLRGAARVDDDVHFGTSLSRPFVLDWPAQAQRTAPAVRPDVVVVLLGASEGLPFGAVGCCGADWSAEYALRAGAMMRSYAQGGAAQVYWLTLPATRDVERHPALLAVNLGLQLAADGLGPAASVLDLAGALTPGFAFRRSMRVDGTSTRVRAQDGVHLTRGGAIVAGHVVLSAMRRDAVLREPSRGR
jgi:hypothetical protein